MIGEPVVRIRAGEPAGEDPYGNPLPSADTETALTGGAFAPGGSLEPVELGRESVVTTPKLYFRSIPDVISTDRLRVRGATYSVVGNPARWVNPYRGADVGLVIELLRVEG